MNATSTALMKFIMKKKIAIKKSDVQVFHDDGCFAVRQGNRTINLNSKETMSYIAFHFKKR